MCPTSTNALRRRTAVGVLMLALLVSGGALAQDLTPVSFQTD